MSLDEASRQLEQAIHDAQVAFDCIALGHINRAHTNALTARTAADAAETALRAALRDSNTPMEDDDDL
jgi:predicted kinase